MPSTISIARTLAAQHPDAALPCPVCAASLKARNLDRHLREVHAMPPSDEAPLPAALELTGVDRRVFWLFTIPALLFVVGLAGMALLGVSEPLLVTLITLLLASLVPLALAAAGRFRARLVLDERRVELRYAFGLKTLDVSLPAALEAGGLWGTRQAAGMHQYEHSPAEDVRVGGYVRLTDGTASLIIGAAGSTQLRKHWTAPELRAGPRRRRWDITLDRVSHVRLQYHLAALGILAPRSTAQLA